MLNVNCAQLGATFRLGQCTAHPAAPALSLHPVERHPAHLAPPAPASSVPPAHPQRLESHVLRAASVEAVLVTSKTAPPRPAITARQGHPRPQASHALPVITVLEVLVTRLLCVRARWTHIPSLFDARLMDIAGSEAQFVQGTKTTRAQTSWTGYQGRIGTCIMAVEELMLNTR